MMMGYAIGMHAPGRALMFDALPVAHHLLLAPRPGRDRAARRRRDQRRLRQQPRPDVAGQRRRGRRRRDQALRRALERHVHRADAARPLPGRPAAAVRGRSSRTATWPTIRQPLDFYGVNYYNPFKIGAAGEDAEMPFEFRELLGYPVTDFGWPVVPDALREWLIMLRARFRAALPPIYDHRVRLRLQHGPGRERRRRRPAAHRLPRRRTCARSPPPSSAASTSAATTRGR